MIMPKSKWAARRKNKVYFKMLYSKLRLYVRPLLLLLRSFLGFLFHLQATLIFPISPYILHVRDFILLSKENNVEIITQIEMMHTLME
jgi:hypothetical protein